MQTRSTLSSGIQTDPFNSAIHNISALMLGKWPQLDGNAELDFCSGSSRGTSCDWLGYTHTLCMLKPHAASWQQRRYSGSQSIKPCYANCKIIISVPTSAEYPNSHSISRIIPLCSFSIPPNTHTRTHFHFLLVFIFFFFFFFDIFLSNSSSAK